MKLKGHSGAVYKSPGISAGKEYQTEDRESGWGQKQRILSSCLEVFLLTLMSLLIAACMSLEVQHVSHPDQEIAMGN